MKTRILCGALLLFAACGTRTLAPQSPSLRLAGEPANGAAPGLSGAAWDDYRHGAGRLDDGTLKIHLRAQEVDWLPWGEDGQRREIYPLVVADGSLNFSSDRPGGLGRFDLYRAQRRADGSFAEPVNVGRPINSEFGTGDTFVAPDESYLIFSSARPGGFGDADLYLSFRQADGSWGEPVNLGESINTDGHEYCPMVTLDGRYLFFSRRVGPSMDQLTAGNVFWVDARVIDRSRR